MFSSNPIWAILLRYAISAAGTALATKGIVQEGQWTGLVDAATTLIGTLIAIVPPAYAAVINKGTVKVPTDSKAAGVARTEAKRDGVNNG